MEKEVLSEQARSCVISWVEVEKWSKVTRVRPEHVRSQFAGLSEARGGPTAAAMDRWARVERVVRGIAGFPARAILIWHFWDGKSLRSFAVGRDAIAGAKMAGVDPDSLPELWVTRIGILINLELQKSPLKGIIEAGAPVPRDTYDRKSGAA